MSHARILLHCDIVESTSCIPSEKNIWLCCGRAAGADKSVTQNFTKCLMGKTKVGEQLPTSKAPTVSFTFTPESSIKQKWLDKLYNHLYTFNTPYIHSYHKIAIFVHHCYAFEYPKI